VDSPVKRAAMAVVGVGLVGCAVMIVLLPFGPSMRLFAPPLAIVLGVAGGTLAVRAVTDEPWQRHARNRAFGAPPDLRRTRVVRCLSGLALVGAAVATWMLNRDTGYGDDYQRLRNGVAFVCALAGGIQLVRGLFLEPPRSRERQVF
jgi:hypothetical protein